jgi:hypothetical protein
MAEYVVDGAAETKDAVTNRRALEAMEGRGRGDAATRAQQRGRVWRWTREEGARPTGELLGGDQEREKEEGSIIQAAGVGQARR